VNYFGLDPDVVYSGATAMSRESATAAAAARSALSGLVEAASVVGHPVLTGAFHTVAEEHAALHHSVGPSVQAFANSIAGGTNTIVDAQNESSAVQRGSYTAAQGTLRVSSARITA
jgi:hypothetical protein